MSNDKPVDPKPKGLHEDRSELWYVCTGIVNSHETGDDLKQMALGIREQLRLEARVNELTDLFYQVKAERDKFINDAAIANSEKIVGYEVGAPEYTKRGQS